MPFPRAVCLLLLLTGALCAGAQPPAVTGTRQPRILLLVDASSSMLQPWGGGATRFKTAGAIISALIDSIYTVNAGVEFGLRVYGHQSPAQNNDCYDSRQEVMFSKNNATQMALRLASLKPYGVSPIAYSLKEAAANDLVDDARNAYSIILITDGGESCGGDICDVVKTLIERRIYFKPYIVSLVDYAPLRQQYACLGTYLQVTGKDDIPVAINTIVSAYRPMLSLPIMAVKTDTAALKPPAIKIITNVEIPKVTPRPQYTEIPSLGQVIAMAAFPVASHYPQPRRLVVPHLAAVSKPPLPEIVALPFLLPKRHDTIAAIARLRVSLKTGTPAIIRLPLPVKPPPDTVVLVIKPQPPPVKRDTIIAVKPRDTATKTRVVITKIKLPKDTARPRVVASAIRSNNPTETIFKRETEDSKETTLSILFTDGHGKFYASTPQLQLLDAVTGKQVKQFYRTVNPAGNPDPQTVPPGTYNLLVAGRANMLMRRIVVEANKNNKITVQVNNGSLRFRYEEAPNRPITEFDAIVNIRFEPGPTIKQRCTAELPYAPGNYYIEINTMPISRFNVDIDFGAITEIQIPEPGFVQFINTSPRGAVSLYAPLGNKFVRFYGLNITGSPAAQKLQLKPGAYEVHWVKNPGLPTAAETVDRFNVQSNSITEVELH